jgi:hypothetical protein
MIACAVIGAVLALALLAYALCRAGSRADELTDEHLRRAASGDWP